MQHLCSHCGLECEESALIIQGEEYFCCHGCQGVYNLLRESGLEQFYERKGAKHLDPVRGHHDDLKLYDNDDFLDKYTISHSLNEREISLILEGIHCVACVWLNEKVLNRTEGINEAIINFTTNKAKIRWNPALISLSSIIETIRSIGYNAYPYDASLQEQKADRARKEYYHRMIVAIFTSMNIMWIAIAQYAGYFMGMDNSVKTILNVAEWILATPTLFYSGFIFYRGAYYGIRNGIINMDFLVSAGATLTYIYSIYATLSQTGETYFDSVTMIITFVLVGKFLEVLSKKSAVDTLDRLGSILPTQVCIIEDNEAKFVPVSHVVEGTLVEIKAGDYIALDGIIEVGEANFDESKITGESLPVFKQKGDELLSGSYNLDGVVRYRIQKAFEKSFMSVIISLLENAMNEKPHIEQTANRLSVYFSQIILTLALTTFIGWFLYNGSFEHALIVAISVVVIACPCALALATPLASLIGISHAATQGVVFKSAAGLETLAQATVFCFDKTGTLTQGKPYVVGVEGDIHPFFTQLASLATSSHHPLSRAISEYLGVCENQIAEGIIKEIKGRGIEMQGDKHTYFLAGLAYLNERNIIPLETKYEGSYIFFGCDNTVLALFVCDDQLKSDSIEAISTLKQWGEVVMLTGDHEKNALRFASQLSIGYHANMTPISKEVFIQEAQKKGKRVVMVGDGLNDILAIARADIGIAMENGSSLSVEASDVVILKNTLKGVARAVAIAHRTYSTIKQNLVLSLGYNVITLPIAIAGYVIPLVAALSMSLSSLMVVLNSLRIKKGK